MTNQTDYERGREDGRREGESSRSPQSPEDELREIEQLSRLPKPLQIAIAAYAHSVRHNWNRAWIIEKLNDDLDTLTEHQA